MNNLTNIEKSGFNHGQYVGYGGGRVWRISKTTSSFGNWIARNQINPNDFIYSFKLSLLNAMLANLETAPRHKTWDEIEALRDLHTGPQAEIHC